MENNLEKPTWCYKPIENVPNLDKIQKEFYRIFTHFYKNTFDDVGHDIIQIDINMVNKLTPNFINFIKKLDLYDILTNVAFSGSVGKQKEICPIHIDTKEWQNVSYALNLPIIGCENSYTVFYKVIESAGSEKTTKVTNRYEGSVAYPDNSSEEIDRMPAGQPAFVNVSVPHRPVTNHTDLRIVVTARFSSKIFDYVDNEIFKTK